MKKKISIIGYGRFSKALIRLLSEDFEVRVYDPNIDNKDFEDLANTTFINELEDVFKNKIIIYAIPINKLDQALTLHSEYINSDHLLIDVSSVKEYSKKKFLNIVIKKGCEALITHPLFGPDSTVNGFENKKVVVDPDLTTISTKTLEKAKDYLVSKNLEVIELDSEEHDKIMSRTQSLVHFIGRALNDIEFTKSQVSTLGGDYLKYIKETSINDTYELFIDLHSYNKYATENRIKFINSIEEIHIDLLKSQRKEKTTTYGIQGGVGSFNEIAINKYFEKNKVKNYNIDYLYTTENVLKKLSEGRIDFGLFAIHNSIGGIVSETIQAIARYKYTVVQIFGLPIQHHLMKSKNIKTEKLTTILAHPQVLKQCKTTLSLNYNHLNQSSGLGDNIDTAQMAKNLFNKKIDVTNAILGPRILAKLYDLEIIAEDLQDSNNNVTYFLLVTN